MKNVDYFDERERSVGYAERNPTTKTMMMLNAMRSLCFNLGTSDVFD
jgi:hypothetical protein